MISAVARIFEPGCKVDTVPVLEGEQGIRKSSLIRALAGDEWFLEMSVTDVSNKDAMQVLRRKWIAEFPEIDGISKGEFAHVKAFFSRQVDTYRPSFGKGSRDFLRQIVFCASTNRDDYGTDETGLRRYWPIRCLQCDVAYVTTHRDQLWAEAVVRYRRGEEWHVTDPELVDEFKQQQSDRYRSDAWEEKIERWLLAPVDHAKFRSRADAGVTTGDVIELALKIEPGKIGPGDEGRVARCLRRLGWIRGAQQRRDGVRVRLYRPVASEDAESPENVVPIGSEIESGSDVDGDDAFPGNGAFAE
jgi:predicted P-loop ATPase